METVMNKKSVVDMIQTHLNEELDEARRNQQDEQAQSLERALLMYRFLPLRDFGQEDVIVPGSLAEVELQGRTSWVLLVPGHGGLVTFFEGKPVQVVTPQSPLGEAMLGKKAGDTFAVTTHSGQRDYRILRIC